MLQKQWTREQLTNSKLMTIKNRHEHEASQLKCISL